METRIRLTFDDKTQTRDVTACLPQEQASDMAFIFCADGQYVPYFAKQLHDELAAYRVGLIGVHSSPAFRGQEYVEGRDEQCFKEHESFFINVVRDWAQTQACVPLTCNNSATFGFSCGGAFAVSMGIRHPNLFGSVIALSIAGRPVRVDQPPPDVHDLTQSRFYLAAGESEPGSIKNYTKRLASWIRKNGGQSETRLSPGGHELSVWQHELRRGIQWLWTV